MLSLRFETVNRFVGILFIASIGILVTLLTLTFLGTAFQPGKVSTSVYFINASSNTSTTTTIAGSPPIVFDVYNKGPFLARPVQYLDKLQEQPIRTGAEISACATMVLGILYLVLKQLNRQVSEEIFP
jgi:hypothetical protein